MAELIYARSTRDDNRVVFYEKDSAHPDGQAWVAGSEASDGSIERVPTLIARTPGVNQALAGGLIEVVPEAEAERYLEAREDRAAVLREQAMLAEGTRPQDVPNPRELRKADDRASELEEKISRLEAKLNEAVLKAEEAARKSEQGTGPSAGASELKDRIKDGELKEQQEQQRGDQEPATPPAASQSGAVATTPPARPAKPAGK